MQPPGSSSESRHATDEVVPARAPSMGALALVTGVSPFATDLYLAALPQMQRNLHSSAATMQLTLTTFVVGFAVGQLLSGPLSDGLGRRRFVLAGTVTFTVTSALCAATSSAELLVVVRALQGLAGGVAATVGRAMVSDTWQDEEAAARFATLVSLFLLGPVVAPALGSALLLVTDWRGTFVAMALLGAAMTVAAVRGLPETRPPQVRDGRALLGQFGRFSDLLRDPPFVGLLVVACLSSAAVFVYVGGSPFVFQTALGVGPSLYGVVFAVNAAAMTAGSLAFRSTVRRWGAPRLQQLGILVSTAAALGLTTLAVLHRADLVVTWLLLGALLAGVGLAAPAHTIRVQAAGGPSAGSAAALNGGLTYAVGALAVPLVGLLGRPSVLTMAGAMAATLLVQVVTVLVVNRRTAAAGLDR